MKLYKEPTIVMITFLIASFLLCYFIINPPNTSATVDNKVPVPLQLSDSSSNSYLEQKNANAVKSIAKKASSTSGTSALNPTLSGNSSSADNTSSIFNSTLK